uniref:rapamycin-insensitive companion of mTOR isoform X3 n=1 Tax=Myxine glutinosa TaxID=7769 RepID=UPI00358F50D2
MFCFHSFEAQCVDIQQGNEVERTQALRLIRKILAVGGSLFPPSLASSLVAVGKEGHQERDRLARACLATLCELAIVHPKLFVQRGGVATVIRGALECSMSRMNEALVTTATQLVNHPSTRCLLRPNELEQILAPFTDLHYRLRAEDGQREEEEARLQASRMALVAALRSWAGLLWLCREGGGALLSVLGILHIPHSQPRKAVLDVLFDIFRLTIPVWSQDFAIALRSTEPGYDMDGGNCRISEGFIVAEAEAVIPHHGGSRPNLIDMYLALLLSTCLQHGLLEGLAEVVCGGQEEELVVRATILLGEILHKCSSLLPHELGLRAQLLPPLVNRAAGFHGDPRQRQRAVVALARLSRFHDARRRPPHHPSLYLSLLLSRGARAGVGQHGYPTEINQRLPREGLTAKECDEMMMISRVLNHKENLKWDWTAISMLLAWPNVNLKVFKDESMHRWLRRLVYFYKPSSRLFSTVDASHPMSRRLVRCALALAQCLARSEEEGECYLDDLLRDVVQWLGGWLEGARPSGERCSIGGGGLSQYYPLLLGYISGLPRGARALERTGVFQMMLSLVRQQDTEPLNQLLVSALDYGRDGLARVMLCKALTGSGEGLRLFSTRLLCVLVRVGAPFVGSWGLDLMLTQLHDPCPAVACAALSALEEACDSRVYLIPFSNTLYGQRKSSCLGADETSTVPPWRTWSSPAPSVSLLFASISKGFSFLNERGFVSKELARWQQGYAVKYVAVVEEALNEALTTYRRPRDGETVTRRSSARSEEKPAFLPSHLYGQLAAHKLGCTLLQAQVFPELTAYVRNPRLDTWEGVRELKAALWGLGHIGASPWGVTMLAETALLPDIADLARTCPVLSVRGTCLYVMGLVASTQQGCDALRPLGWEGVRRALHHPWPLPPDDGLVPPPPPLPGPLPRRLPSTPSSISLRSGSVGSRHTSEGEGLGYILSPDDDTTTPCYTPTPPTPHTPTPPASHTPTPPRLSHLPEQIQSRFPSPPPSPEMHDKQEGVLKPRGSDRTLALLQRSFRRSRLFNSFNSLNEARSRANDLASSQSLEQVPEPGSGGSWKCLRSRTAVEAGRSNDKSGQMPSSDFQTTSIRPPRTLEGLLTLPRVFKGKSFSGGLTYRTANSTPSARTPESSTYLVQSTLPATPTSPPSKLSTSSVQTNESLTSPIFMVDPTELPSPAGCDTLGEDGGEEGEEMQQAERESESPSAPDTLPFSPSPDISRKDSKQQDEESPEGPQGSPPQIPMVPMHPAKTPPSHLPLAKSNSALLTAREEAHTLPRRAHSLRAEAVELGTGLIGEGRYTSLQDARGYATLRLLQRQRQQPMEEGASGTGGPHRFQKALSFISLDREDILNPAVPQRSPSLHSLPPSTSVPRATPLPDSLDYIGIALPSRPFLLFQIDDLGPSNGEEKQWEEEKEGTTNDVDKRLTDLASSSIDGINDAGEWCHHSDSCLLCVCKEELKCSDFPFADDSSTPAPPLAPPLGDGVQKRCSNLGGSDEEGCTKATGVGHGRNDEVSEEMLRREVIRLVVNLSSAVGAKAQETGLLTMRERFPWVFGDVCLYSDVCLLLSRSTFRLPARRFIQELFQDGPFLPLYEQAESVLKMSEITSSSAPAEPTTSPSHSPFTSPLFLGHCSSPLTSPLAYHQQPEC